LVCIPPRLLDLFIVQSIVSHVPRRRSHETKLVLQMLLDAPIEEAYGLQVVRATGLPTGSAYAILRRLEDEGLLDSRWETLDSSQAGRPPRRYYRLNGEGHRVAHRETAAQRTALRALAPGWRVV
jgi:PadR family transcriptional regulator, regulatory protein PadR